MSIKVQNSLRRRGRVMRMLDRRCFSENAVRRALEPRKPRLSPEARGSCTMQEVP